MVGTRSQSQTRGKSPSVPKSRTPSPGRKGKVPIGFDDLEDKFGEPGQEQVVEEGTAEQWTKGQTTETAEHQKDQQDCRERRHQALKSLCFGRGFIESALTQNPVSAEKLLPGSFCRVFIRAKDKPGVANDKTKGRWVVVQITSVVNVDEPYVLKDAGAKTCKVKLEIERTKATPREDDKDINDYKSSCIQIRLDQAHPYEGNADAPHGLTKEECDNWIDSQLPDKVYSNEIKDKKTGEVNYDWDREIHMKCMELIEFSNLVWTEDRIDAKMQEKRMNGETLDSNLKQATEKRQLIKEIQDQLSGANTKQGETIDEAKVDSLKKQIAEKEFELREMEDALEQERRYWEGKNQNIFGVLNIVKRNREAQNEADRHRDMMPPSLQPGAAKSNPFNRRECMPSVLWGMPKARKQANKTEDIKPDEEAPMTPEPVSPKEGKAKVTKEYSDLPAHEQKLHNYYESFEKEGLPDVDQLIADMDKNERSRGKKRAATDGAASGFSQGVWDAMIADTDSKSPSKKKTVVSFSDWHKAQK